jgi:hypothetical protein
MLSTVLNQLKNISCDYSNNLVNDILTQDYGITPCKVEISTLDSFKYYKIQKDFLDYYSGYTKGELDAIDYTLKQKETKLPNIITADDELYAWFLANINNINIALNKVDHKTHIQNTVSLTWVFHHNMGFEVNIEVLDENNNPLLGYTRVDSNNFNTITLTWSVAVKGKIIAS